MALPTSILTQVQTYQKSHLALLENSSCFVATANTKFKDFQNITANLGSSVTFDLPPRFVCTQTLIATFQAANQRLQTLTVDQAQNVSYEFTAQERIFNVDKDTESYMKVYGTSAVAELSYAIESNVALNAISGVVSPSTSLPNSASGPYRFFGDAVTPINSFGQLANMIALFKNYGSVKKGIKVYLPDVTYPNIVNTGLNQFALKRNDDMAMSWEVGSFGAPPVEYYSSNLLPIQVAGTVGNSNQTLTVVSTNDPTGANITQITFSGATASDLNAIKYGDLLQFQDGVSGQPNLRYLTFIGHALSANTVQIRATSNAAADGSGNVVINITPALCSQSGNPNQNIFYNISAGMQAKALPSHRAGLIVGGDALFVAMPRLPDQFPYATSAEYDDDTGVSVRLCYGSLFGQNQMGMIHDAVWGSVLVPEYSMRIAIPL